MICCFAGHRIINGSIFPEIKAAVEKIVSSNGETIFYSGGMGEFDKMCESAVRQVKKEHPDSKIKLCKVLPSYKYAKNTTADDDLFDEIFVCDASDDAYYKSMIIKRNRWLIENSDCLIAHVVSNFGGAYDTLRYAKRLGIEIIMI